MIKIFNKVIAVVISASLIMSSVLMPAPIKGDAATVLTSPLIKVDGFQINTALSDELGITFRTVCNAPDIGSVITVDGNDYTITDYGTIYCKDPNTSGYNSDRVLEKAHTELNPISYLKEGVQYGFKYIGQYDYQGKYLTFGYIATDKGILKQENGITSYARTLTKMDEMMTNTIFTRAFVEAVDEKGNNVIIYGQSATLTSIAEIAYKIYTGGSAPTQAAHKYLFANILHKITKTNPYYIENEEEYGWGGVVKPGESV